MVRLESLHRETPLHAIIHSGAMVLHMRPYENLRTANVSAGLEVARFCRRYGLALHHVSTMLTPDYEEYGGVGGGAEQFVHGVRQDVRPFLRALGDGTTPTTAIAPVNLAPPAARELNSGYTLSKWMGEYAVRLVHRNAVGSTNAGTRSSPHLPFQLTIHRLGFIGRNAATGVGNEEDMMSRMIRGALQVGCAIKADTDMQVLPADYAARLFSGLVWKKFQVELAWYVGEKQADSDRANRGNNRVEEIVRQASMAVGRKNRASGKIEMAIRLGSAGGSATGGSGTGRASGNAGSRWSGSNAIAGSRWSGSAGESPSGGVGPLRGPPRAPSTSSQAFAFEQSFQMRGGVAVGPGVLRGESERGSYVSGRKILDRNMIPGV